MTEKEELIKAFGKRVKATREHLRFKQKDFVRSIGVAGRSFGPVAFFSRTFTAKIAVNFNSSLY